MEDKGFVNIKFIVFLKATLGKMMATGILPENLIDLHFWQSWPRKFYNIKSYNSIKAKEQIPSDREETIFELESPEPYPHSPPSQVSVNNFLL